MISRITFDKSGHTAIKQEAIINNPRTTCCHEMTYNLSNQNIYIIESRKNVIIAYHVETNLFKFMSKNNDINDENGLLDQPCEPLKGDKLIIINFAPLTISQLQFQNLI